MVGRGLNSAWPDTDCGEFDHGQEVGAEFFVAVAMLLNCLISLKNLSMRLRSL